MKNSCAFVIESAVSIVYMGMMNRPEKPQLQELRARTDRDLIAWIGLRLEAGLRSRGPEAEKIYLEVAPLLLLSNAGAADRARLEAQLEELAERFETACASA